MSKKRKKTKNVNGEGSIVKRKDGLYMGVATIGRDLNGKLIRKYVYGKTKIETVKKLTEVQSKIYKGVFSEPSGMTLKNWLSTWLETYKKIDILAQTKILYETLIKTIINPNIGDLKLKDITQMHIQLFFNKISDNYSDSTLKKLKNILNPAFKIAVINKLINENPYTNINMASKKESKKVKCLNEEEIKIFKNAVVESYYRDCFLIQLDTGLRIGELLALTWKDINFEKKLINVNKTIVKQKDSSGKQIIICQSFPKTNAGKRTVPMTDECFKVLSERNRNKFDSELLFPSKNNTFIDPNNIRRNLRGLCKKTNLENFSTHTLRHTFSTRLFNKNIHPKTVAILMGHSKVEIALNNYTHVDDENKFNAIDKLN